MPKYLELVSWIQEQIETKKMLPGQKLHSENELSEKFGLSRQTVLHAISVRVNDGVLKRVPELKSIIILRRLCPAETELPLL